MMNKVGIKIFYGGVLTLFLWSSFSVANVYHQFGTSPVNARFSFEPHGIGTDSRCPAGSTSIGNMRINTFLAFVICRCGTTAKFARLPLWSGSTWDNKWYKKALPRDRIVNRGSNLGIDSVLERDGGYMSTTETSACSTACPVGSTLNAEEDACVCDINPTVKKNLLAPDFSTFTCPQCPSDSTVSGTNCVCNTGTPLAGTTAPLGDPLDCQTTCPSDSTASGANCICNTGTSLATHSFSRGTSFDCNPCPADSRINAAKDACVCKYDSIQKNLSAPDFSTFTCPQCPTGSTKLSGTDAGSCKCSGGAYKFAQTQANFDQGAGQLCYCPFTVTPRTADGSCITRVRCSNGSRASSGICCPNGDPMPVGGACCPNGSPVRAGIACPTKAAGNPPIVDLSIPRTFNVHGDPAVRSTYSIGRTDRPDYVCYAYKIENRRELRIQQPSAMCPKMDECTLDKKNRCLCQTLQSGNYVDITAENNGPRVGEGTRYRGLNTYCEYANLDPLRLFGSEAQAKLGNNNLRAVSKDIVSSSTTTITVVVSPPH